MMKYPPKDAHGHNGWATFETMKVRDRSKVAIRRVYITAKTATDGLDRGFDLKTGSRRKRPLPGSPTVLMLDYQPDYGAKVIIQERRGTD